MKSMTIIDVKNIILLHINKLKSFSVIGIIAFIIIGILIINSRHKIEKYMYDNFPFQAHILKFIAKYNELVQDNSNRNKAFRGKDGWLFLGNDYARTVDALQGVNIDSRAHQRFFSLIRDLANQCRTADIPFMVMIGPNKHTIYPEYLPDWLHPVNTGVREALAASLEQEGIPVFDPTALLKSNKNKRLLYYRTDTHWNIAAGAIAYNGLKNFISSHFQINWPPLPAYELIDGQTGAGDLIRIGNFQYFNLRDGDTFILKWYIQPSLLRYSYDGESYNLAKFSIDIESEKNSHIDFNSTDIIVNNSEKHIDIIKNTAPISQQTVVIFGDSFEASISPFFNNIFKKVIYISRAGAPLWSSELLKYLNPDIIIFLCVERGFIHG
ncbi:MAG: hypothetical protein J1E80_02280 [Desulfovibrionaceae bacterium]|nr:hypothetical protein [Desulfovibrionaceae bacterium]